MSNHIHLVLRNRPDVVQTWSVRDVVIRWLTATKLAKSRDGQAQPPQAARMALELLIPGRVKVLRRRLSDPSWFMGILCEYVARRSNREDLCRGTFGEERHKCRNLADEGAILVCGIYVDLNPIRAGEAPAPESSRHTSADDRIGARQQKLRAQQGATDLVPLDGAPDGWMCELTLDERAPLNDPRWWTSASARRASDKGLLPVRLDDYLQLLDASGRIVREGKSGATASHLQPILDRLGTGREMWSALVIGYDEMFGQVVGAFTEVSQRAARAGRRWCRGQSHCAAAFTR